MKGVLGASGRNASLKLFGFTAFLMPVDVTIKICSLDKEQIIPGGTMPRTKTVEYVCAKLVVFQV